MADDETPAHMSEDTKERYRSWWLSRSPEERARLRGLNGSPVTPHELVFLNDSEGLPLAGDPGHATDPPGVFLLPEFLFDEEGDEGGARPAVDRQREAGT